MKFGRNFSRVLAAATALCAISATSTLAADLAITPDPVMNYASSTFNWDGFYAGVGVSGSTWSNGGPALTALDLDAVVGVNYTYDDFLIGLEASVGPWWDSAPNNGYAASLEARAGMLVTPETLLYASGGAYKFLSGGGVVYGYVGAGAEYAVSSNVTVDAEYRYLGWSTTGWTSHMGTVSALWHFN